MNYRFREKEGIINVLENGKVIAKYQIDRHWEEKNLSIKGKILYIRLYNRTKKYLDCKVELYKEEIQYIPNKNK